MFQLSKEVTMAPVIRPLAKDIDKSSIVPLLILFSPIETIPYLVTDFFMI